MNFYQEITLIDHAEISPGFVWSKLYGQIHLAFVEHKNSNEKISYGVSFPNYHYDSVKDRGYLGKKLRIFTCTEAELVKLDVSKWLSRLLDYVHVQSIKAVPMNRVENYAVYKRKQMKGAKRLQTEIDGYAAKYAERNGVEITEALKVYEHMKVREAHLPFVNLKSLHSDQNIKLFIEKEILEIASNEQIFSTYGLNSQLTKCTVPEF